MIKFSKSKHFPITTEPQLLKNGLAPRVVHVFIPVLFFDIPGTIRLLHGQRRDREKLFCREFLRKYIMIAKMSNPTLTQDACTVIAEKYADLRSQDHLTESTARTQPVTARALETMIRLATAHAKVRLAKKVELKDANAACDMVEFAYFKKVRGKNSLWWKKSDRQHFFSDKISVLLIDWLMLFAFILMIDRLIDWFSPSLKMSSFYWLIDWLIDRLIDWMSELLFPHSYRLIDWLIDFS